MRKKILTSILVSSLLLLFTFSAYAEIKIFFSPKGSVAEEIITQIDNAGSDIDIAIYSFTSKPISEETVKAIAA